MYKELKMSLDVSLYIDVDTGAVKPKRVYLHDSNITHNLNEMAIEAGIYEHLWRPEEIVAKYAGDIIADVEICLNLMKSDPERFKKFNSPNGWGLYKNFIPWIEEYLTACKENPKAIIEVSR